MIPYPVPARSERPLQPEVVDPRIADVEALARWLDYAFALPGGFRFGLAGIIGLVPGIGDLFDAILSLYIVGRAVQLRIARVAIARMLVNVGIEAFMGAIPILGDLFDIAFKANRRNYQILKKHMVEPQRQTGRDWIFLIITIVLVVASITLPLIAVIELFRYLSQ